MKNRVFLEQTENKEWMDTFIYISKNQLERRGFEVIPFIGKVEGYVNKNSDFIIGGVQATQDFFNKCCIKTPSYLGYPESLQKYLHRNIEKVCIKNIKMKFPYFIKPADMVKQFTGELIENESTLKFMKEFMDVSEDLLVYVSEPIEFISEYRCFVHRNELRGIQYYQGDYTKYIDSTVVEQMIEDYKDEAPIAYTLDVGATKYGTSLVEINDMWSIGDYGFDYKEYVSMCIDRMIEIKKI